MKLILAFTLTLYLFACKPKEETPLSPSISGTYSNLHTVDNSYLFHQLLPNHSNFNEKIIANVSQIDPSRYSINIKMSGKAQNGTTVNDYGFEANIIASNPKEMVFSANGTYNTIIPSSPNLSPDKEVRGQVSIKEGTLDLSLMVIYNKDGLWITKALLSKTE